MGFFHDLTKFCSIEVWKILSSKFFILESPLAKSYRFFFQHQESGHPIGSFAVNNKLRFKKTHNRNINFSCGFQRAVLLSYGGCAIAVVMAIPATLFGAVAKATDWSKTEWGQTPKDGEATLVLPLCLQVNADS